MSFWKWKFWRWFSNRRSWKNAYNNLCLRSRKKIDILEKENKHLKELLSNAYDPYGYPIDEEEEYF